MGLQIFDEVVPIFQASTIDDTMVPTDILAYGATTRASRVDNLVAATDSTVDTVVTVNVQDVNGNLATLGTVTVPAGAGHIAGVAAVDLVAAIPTAQDALVMAQGSSVSVHVPATLSAGSFFSLLTLGGLV